MDRMADDLGGEKFLSSGELAIIRRCAMIVLECEKMEHKALNGADLNATLYGQLTGSLSRALRTIGLKREPREAAPVTLEQYLERQANGTFKAEAKDETAGNA
jgi:hypothetical protein